MPKTKHRYRVSVYLGKENYEQLEGLAVALNIPVASMTRVLIDTGFQVAKAIEKGDKTHAE